LGLILLGHGAGAVCHQQVDHPCHRCHSLHHSLHHPLPCQEQHATDPVCGLPAPLRPLLLSRIWNYPIGAPA
ncbi:unnamed protein product, partial [Closterium sp. NIES-53]